MDFGSRAIGLGRVSKDLDSTISKSKTVAPFWWYHYRLVFACLKIALGLSHSLLASPAVFSHDNITTQARIETAEYACRMHRHGR